MTSISIKPLRDDLQFGARISGVTLEALADAEVRKQINDAFEERGMIVFEDVEPSGDLQVELSTVFGALKEHPIPTVPRAGESLAPGVIEISQMPGKGNIVEIEGKLYTSWLPWHFDHCYNNELNRAGVLRCVQGVTEGGQTAFADGVELYNAISPDLRAKIENAEILYTLNLAFDEMRFGLPKGFKHVQAHEALQKTVDYGKNLPRAIHPAVWTRESGEKVLHVSPWMAVGIVGNEDPEGDQVFEALCQEILAKVNPYYHQWKPTDMVIWDNWRMLHAVTGHSVDQGRRMHRTTIKGDYGLGRFEGGAAGDKILEMTV